MDLMEQIRLEATKYAAEFENACQSRDEDCGKIAPAFQSGAQALLNLLGRSATSEGHPPRGYVSGNHIAFGNPLPAEEEYLSLKEHQALRAADLLEIERLQELSRTAHDTAWVFKGEEITKLRAELTAEREARKGDSAEIARLESQLKTWEGRCDRLTAALVDLKGIWMRRHGTEEMCRSRDPQGEFSLICMSLGEAGK